MPKSNLTSDKINYLKEKFLPICAVLATLILFSVVPIIHYGMELYLVIFAW